MASELHIGLARTLPSRLQRFFAFNPPRALSSAVSAPSSTAAAPPSMSLAPTSRPNPFQPHKNPRTGKWHPPIYSLRVQAELVKLAESHGVQDLLPFTTKSVAERTRKREEQGLRVKGTGVGQKVKGHEWERTLKGRLEKRRQAMLGMPQLIQQWKEVCYAPLVQGHPGANITTAWTRSRMEEVAEIRAFTRWSLSLKNVLESTRWSSALATP